MPEILYVEDNDSDVRLMRAIVEMERLDVELSSVASAGEAFDELVARLGSSRELPLFVLVDLNLPRGSGVDLTARVRAHDSLAHLPMVIYSSSRALSDRKAAYRAGANGFLTKRMDLSAIGDALRMLVTYWTAMTDGLE